ncbi:MAG: hypothetical protein AABX01_04510 [Candidatus Micrarchaeota archaeon]
MRALLSIDFLISLLLSSFTLILLIGAFFLQANSLSHQLSQIERERDAIFLADMLLSSCANDFGLADCSKGYLDANVISNEDLIEFKKIPIKSVTTFFGLEKDSKFEISILLGDGQNIPISSLPPNGESTCIKRLAIQGGRHIILEVCA